MATTQQIMDAAEKLGELIAAHPTTEKFEQAVRKLQDDVDAQRALNDHNRQLSSIADKESKGKPIEVEDKRRLQDLQKKIIANPTLQALQLAQMDYLDLMRKVDEAMSGPVDAEAAMPQSVGPDLAIPNS